MKKYLYYFLLCFNLSLAIVPLAWFFLPLNSIFCLWAELYAVLLVLNTFFVSTALSGWV